LKLKESADAEGLQATSRENYMLDLMASASLDMEGKFFLLCFLFPLPRANSLILIIILDTDRFLLGCYCRRSAC
jgi:hypothetical protein